MNTLPSNCQENRLPLERVAQAREKDESLSSPQPLSHYRDVHAWVLLADPGAGKSDVFETLSQVEGGYCTSARDFVDLDLPADWIPPLFIDGLDEITAGGTTGATPLTQLRKKLQQLGTPKFRISCRAADWRGNADGQALQRLVGRGNFAELHLAPLSQAQTLALIAHWQPCSEAKAREFVREAEKHDMEGLLVNPQTLRMLVKAIGASGNQWPDSKTQAFEMACEQLVREHNGEHLANTRDITPPDDQVLLAAGYLCAVMLLSGSGAIALQRRSEPHAGVMSLPELVSADSAPGISDCRVALHSRLFRGPGDFSPVHRTVAEYLGARYLAKRICQGLPAGRVLALMLGQDGGVVPELRGLHAWLAAVAPEALRRELIDNDPLGVVLNGDVRNFSRAEKLQMLQALRDEATRHTYFRSQNRTSHPFGALATADMGDDFKALLQSTDRSPPHVALLDCVLDALAYGQHMPALTPSLEQVVRDKTYRSDLRTAALSTLATYAQENGNWSTLTQLLADIHSNVVDDLDDELLGTLLQALYPIHLAPTDLWRYFRQPKAEGLLGSYRNFWYEVPKKNTPREDVPALLDALFASGYQLTSQRDRLRSSTVVGELLVRGVTQSGKRVDLPRLYNWLSLGLDSHLHCRLDHEHKEALGQWFGAHPAQYKAMFEHGLSVKTSMGDGGFRNLWGTRARLYGAPAPDDAGSWYLLLAKSCADDDLRRQLVSESFQLTHQRNGPNTAIELLGKWSSDHPIDAAWVAAELQCQYPPSESTQQDVDFDINAKERKAEETRHTIAFFRETLPSFVNGPAHMGALVEVADAYLNIYSDSKGETPGERLLGLLNSNVAWVELALHGLRQSLFRTDLPSAAQIVDLNAKGQRYHLAMPCLAAMELRYTENPTTALDLPHAVLEAVAAFHLTNHFGNTSDWFKQVLAQRPAVLADVMHRLLSRQITSKTEHVESLYTLARDADYASIAKQISPELIADFPVKASEKQLKNLRLLIVSMLSHLDRDIQLKLIANKLSAKVMDVAQRVYWLTAGVLLAPELYLERTQQFVEKTQVRASHVFALIHEYGNRDGLQADLPATTQAFLVSLLGPRSSPKEPPSGRAYRVTHEMEMGEYVAGLISALAGNPEDAAMQALTALQQRQDMKHWQDTLSRALYDQRVTRRKALFRPASVSAVCNTLANLKPANAADLSALTVDHLTQLASEIRNGNTNDYRQYWAGATPRIEDDCRDTLLSDLKPRLARVGVLAEPEGRYADEKRADIKVTALPHHIPVEIKRETHPDVWKAIAEQLIAKYGREPASEGYGIYLVFWFTGDMKAAPIDGGGKVKTPKELQQRLAATVPEQLRDKIAVLVVDCSKPQTTRST